MISGKEGLLNNLIKATPTQDIPFILKAFFYKLAGRKVPREKLELMAGKMSKNGLGPVIDFMRRESMLEDAQRKLLDALKETKRVCCLPKSLTTKRLKADVQTLEKLLV